MKKLSITGISILALALNAVCAQAASDQPEISQAMVDIAVDTVNPSVVDWRRDIHEHPELGNREIRTSKLVAEHMRHLGFEVRTGIAKTGVVGILKGAHAGPVIALRADMDALPIKEATGRAFASKVTTQYDGQDDVPVMHACGHDAHTAILMGAASVLAGMKDDLKGTVMFVFQPAEEGAPQGETGGAKRMLEEGIFSLIKPEAMFALHVEPGPVGLINIRQNGFFAGSVSFQIKLSGEGTHAARPWEGNDIVSLGADIVKAMTTISGRQVDIIEEPTVITVASFQAGNRGNVLPGDALLKGTIRSYSQARFIDVKKQMENTVEALAIVYGAKAEVHFGNLTPPTLNDPALVTRILPALRAAAGSPGVDADATRRAAAEDFSYFAQQIPSAYYILGSTPELAPGEAIPSNHSPRFDIDEKVLAVGVKAHVLSVLTYSDSLIDR